MNVRIVMVMKKVNEIYEYDTWGYYDYQPMLNEFGTILLQEDDDDYQGDSFLIYKNNDRYGYLNFGWDSCSGCDALQACRTLDDVQELMDLLYAEIQWFDSLEALKEYFANKDWKLCWEGHSEAFRRFYPQVKELR